MSGVKKEERAKARVWKLFEKNLTISVRNWEPVNETIIKDRQKLIIAGDLNGRNKR